MTEILNVNDTFKDWDAVETAVNMFAKYNSFVTIKFCKDLDIIDKTITRCHVYQCWKAGINNPKKVHDESNAATIFLYLLKQHEEDPNYIVIPRLEGPSNKLTGLFWITSKQRNELWPKFHDVVIHNNTVKMNRYEMALSLFVGINNNFKTRVFAQALTKYETQADYIWILQCTLKVKNNLSPHVLYTDSDPAMLAAVQIVYPQTRHLLYFYHMRNSYTEYQFELRYIKMLTKYELYQSYLKKKLYPNRESWARYAISKVFTAGVESTQRVESINGVLKKHLDQGTLLKELVKVIENELDKEVQYNQIKEYYGSNPSTGLPSTYNTIFKNIDSILKDHLAPIPLSLQQTQMKQSLLYQGILISIDQVKESDNEQSNDIIECIYDKSQIRLQDLLSDINSDEIQEIWEIYYITVTSSTSTSHYVVILKDSTIFCTCMYIINQGMPCRHQYRVLLQSSKAIFYMGFIHPCCSKDKCPTEGVASELIGLLTQFIMKYRHNTGLNIKEVHSISHFNDKIQESSHNYQRQPLVVMEERNILEISNPEYHKPKGLPPK
ncbi:unnamed protein product [Rhizophagus irregularis]|nr:unnamed protein product [Rhizophagus irregularis]